MLQPKTKRTLRDVIVHNESLPCIDGCGRNRVQLAKRCGYCNQAWCRLGHGRARPVREKVYRDWTRQAHRLLEINRDAPSVIHVKAFLGHWIDQAKTAPHTVPLSIIMTKYTHDQVVEALTLMAGFWLYLREVRPSEVPDLRSSCYHLVKIITSYFPVHRNRPDHWTRLKSEDRRATALYLHRNVVPLLEAIVEAWRAEEAEAERVRSLLSQPLDFHRSVEVQPERGSEDAEEFTR
jgi:hypothetical protein